MAIAAPAIVWQAAHGWPNLDVFRSLQTAAGHNRAIYWLAQVLYTGPALTPIWVTGVIWSLRSAAARPFRPVALACVIVIVLQFALGGKAYYPGAVYTFLFAAGPVAHRAAAGGPHVVGRPGLGRRRAVILAGRRGRAADCAAGAARPGAAHGSAAEDQLRPGRDDRLAAAGRADRAGVQRTAAAQRSRTTDPHRELRRSGRGRPLRPRARPARGLQRGQQLLALGPAARRGHRRHRGECGPGACCAASSPTSG